MIIPKGTVILVTRGEHAEYQHEAVIRLRRDINVQNVIAEYGELYPEQAAAIRKEHPFGDITMWGYQPVQFRDWFLAEYKDSYDNLEFFEWYMDDPNVLIHND